MNNTLGTSKTKVNNPARGAQIAFATYAGNPDYQHDDRPLVRALEARGAAVTPAVWNAAPAAFAGADAVVLRSTWDYWHHRQAFEQWLDQLNARAHVYNAPALMRWNISKRYLFALEAAGAVLPPTRLCQPDRAALRAAMASLEVAEAVAKPVVSAGGEGVVIIRPDDHDSLDAAARAITGEALVQPLLPEIRDPGETSFVFFDGVFSHAVVKQPTRDPILCQEEHGGIARRSDPPGFAMDDAHRILAIVAAVGHGVPFYARVDAIVLDGAARVDARFRLMEVELIEPTLFFTQCPEAADRFADALLNRMNR